MGMSTEIGESRELREVPRRKRGQYARMRKWHSRLTGSKDRNLGVAYAELRRLSSQLNLPDTVAEEVARLYEKAVDHDLVRGRSIEGVLAALVYAVARKQGTPRTLEELEEASGIEARDVGRAYRYVARELDLWVPPARPEDYLPRFADDLDLSGAVVARAGDLVEHARDADLLVGKGRTGIAAAVLYTASVLEGEKRTQQEVADAVGVTVETLRSRYQELMQDVMSVIDG
jgi:transcription initiation factor TFIIB